MTPLQQSLSKCKVEGNIVFLPPISEGVLPNYQDVRKAILSAGAKYKRNAFVFPNDAQPYIDKLMGGESVNIKKEFQFFETPDVLADEMVEDSGMKIHEFVLEPSAGQGAIIKAIQRKFPRKNVYYFEAMDININILKKMQAENMFLGPDFLKYDDKYGFDKIIANPPFSKNQDIDHIYKMYECLSFGGTIVTIASNHWRFSNNKKEKEFRTWLMIVNAVVTDVPEGTFKESGTNIGCVKIIIKKGE